MTDLIVDLTAFLTIAEGRRLSKRIAAAQWHEQVSALRWAEAIIEAVAMLEKTEDLNDTVETARELHALVCRRFNEAVDKASGG